jgi:hypothetical protein
VKLEFYFLSLTATNNIAQQASLGRSKTNFPTLMASNNLRLRQVVARLQRAANIFVANPAMLAGPYCWSSSMTRNQTQISKHSHRNIRLFVIAWGLLREGANIAQPRSG